MKSEHLTDKQIQEYLDAGKHKDQIIQKHISICEECRRLVEIYSALYRDLAAPVSAAIPIGIADSVLVRIPAYERRAKKTEYMNILLFIGLGVLLLGVTQYFTDLLPVGRDMLNSLVPSLDLQNGISVESGMAAEEFLSKYRLWIMTFGVLGGVYLFDRVILKKRIFTGMFV